MKLKITAILAAIFSLTLCGFAYAQNEMDEEEDSGNLFEDLFGPSDFEIDWDEVNKHPLGSEGNPVRCDMPAGERAYLNRLRCSDGRAPTYERSGSMGIGPFGHIVDLYAVQCRGEDSKSIIMDMYFPDYVESLAVPGFTIKPAK